MSQKMYMVVMLPKNDDSAELGNHAFSSFTDYDKAFDLFNETVAAETTQLFTQPKRPQPLRAALSDSNIELWIIDRPTELV